MRKDLFDFISLRCPLCKTALALLKVYVIKGEEIEEALLQCKSMRCRRIYPVISYIPVLIANMHHYISLQPGLTNMLKEGSLCDTLIADLERYCGISTASLEKPSEDMMTAKKMTLAYYLLRQYPLHVQPGDELADLIPMKRDSALYGIDEVLASLPFIDGVAVDFGCAAGRFVFELASLTELAIGLDYSFDLVDSASRIRREGKLPFGIPLDRAVFEEAEIHFSVSERGRKTEFVVADAAQSVFAGSSTGLVSALNLITELPEPSKALIAVDAMLKPGGYLLFGSTYNWMVRLEDALLLRLRSFYRSYEELFRALMTGAEPASPLTGRYSIINEKNIPFCAYYEKRRYVLYLMDFMLCRKVQE